MELLDSSCFLGLSPEERMEQLYLSVGGTDPCFLGNSRVDQLRLIAEVLGLDRCIYSESDFYRLWLLSLDAEACTGLALQGLQNAVYALLYDGTGVDPSCFFGLSPDDQEQAIVDAAGGGGIYIITRDPTVLSLGSGESGDVLITLTLISGSAEMATLTIPDLPIGWGAVFSNNPVSTDGGTSTLTLTAP